MRKRKVKIKLLEDWQGHKAGDEISVVSSTAVMLLRYGKAMVVRTWPKDRMVRSKRTITK